METTSQIQSLINSAAPLVPILTAIMQTVKPAISLDKKYLPLITIALGIVAGLGLLEFTVTGGIVGVIIGLGATGVYEVGKNARKG